jgi:hypothetical protein
MWLIIVLFPYIYSYPFGLYKNRHKYASEELALYLRFGARRIKVEASNAKGGLGGRRGLIGKSENNFVPGRERVSKLNYKGSTECK